MEPTTGQELLTDRGGSVELGTWAVGTQEENDITSKAVGTTGGLGDARLRMDVGEVVRFAGGRLKDCSQAHIALSPRLRKVLKRQEENLANGSPTST